MVIERTDDEIIIRIPASIPMEDVQQAVDYLVHRQSIAKSKTTKSKGAKRAVKTTPAKAKRLKEFKEAVDEVNLAIQGKIKLRTAQELLDEL